METRQIKAYIPLLCNPTDENTLVSNFRNAPEVVSWFQEKPDSVIEIPVVWYESGVVYSWTQVIGKDTSQAINRQVVIDTGIIGRVIDTAYDVVPTHVNVWLNPRLSIPNVTIQQARFNDSYQQIWATPSGCEMMDFCVIPQIAALPIVPTLGFVGYSSFGAILKYPYCITSLVTHSYYRRERVKFDSVGHKTTEILTETTTDRVTRAENPIANIRDLFGIRPPKTGDYYLWGDPRMCGSVSLYSSVSHETEYLGDGSVFANTGQSWVAVGMWLSNDLANFSVPISNSQEVIDTEWQDGKWYEQYVCSNHFELYVSPLIVNKFFSVTVTPGLKWIMPHGIALAFIKALYGGGNINTGLSVWLASNTPIGR